MIITQKNVQNNKQKRQNDILLTNSIYLIEKAFHCALHLLYPTRTMD